MRTSDVTQRPAGALGSAGRERAGGARGARPSGRRPPLVLLVPAGVAAVFALLPLGYLAVRALESGPDGPDAIDVVFLDIQMP
ncbi:hypothetical protein IGX29_28425, partial [Streptomyces sp. H28]|nr:hypothetical protein [Streptomyces sp. H28]